MVDTKVKQSSFRGLLSNSPAVGVVVVCAGVIAVVVSLRHAGRPSSAPPTAYFTDDDGATFFGDEDSHICPFDHDGKQAVRAHVFKAANGKQFVGWMEQNNPEAKKELEKIAKERTSNAPFTVSPEERQVIDSGAEYKKPGEKEWKPMPSGMGATFFVTSMRSQMKSPDGSKAEELVITD